MQAGYSPSEDRGDPKDQIAGIFAALPPAVVCVVSLCFWAACAASGRSMQGPFNVVLVVVGLLAALWCGMQANDFSPMSDKRHRGCKSQAEVDKWTRVSHERMRVAFVFAAECTLMCYWAIGGDSLWDWCCWLFWVFGALSLGHACWRKMWPW